MFTSLLLCTLLAFAAAEFRDPILNIVGGSTATEGQFPHQLLLTRSGSFICGAVLVNANVALTAAHCLGSSANLYSVQGGQHNRFENSGHERLISVSSYTMHPDYNGNAAGFPNDIAVMRLSQSFTITGDYIKTITMASSTSSDFAGTTCTISGWGRTSGGGSTASTLQYVNMGCISNSECTTRWSGISGAAINDGHICVFTTGASACSGDSGGPMLCNGVLAGVTSWGISSCSGGYPSVYTRVSHFRSWIDQNQV